jgi:hypothetical protein
MNKALQFTNDTCSGGVSIIRKLQRFIHARGSGSLNGHIVPSTGHHTGKYSVGFMGMIGKKWSCCQKKEQDAQGCCK